MPTERELKDAIEGKQLPAPTNGSSKALELVPSQAWESTYKYSLKEIHGIANTACQAGIFTNTADASKAVVRIFWGLENGLSPMEALNDVYESKGRFYIYADGIVTQLAKRGAHIVFTHTDAKKVVGEVQTADGETIGLPVTFTIEQAAAMGLLDKPAWKSDPESLMCARVVARLNKRVGKRFWQTTVGVREEAEDIDWLERSNAKEDAGAKAIASAGRRRKPEVAEVETVEEAPKESETSKSVAGSAVNTPETQSVSASATQPAKLSSKARSKPASPAQRAELIKACEDAGIEEEQEQALWDSLGVTDENFDEKFTVECFQAAMLYVQGIAEGVR